MKQTISRAQFLRGDFSGRRLSLRPPWHGNEEQFIAACDRCGQCITACADNILQSDPYGLPIVNFQKGECTFCGACAQHCPTGALQYDTNQAPWTLRAVIGDSCLAFKGVVCNRCAEECEVSAIRLRLVAGGIAIPQLDTQHCNGCGACVRSCPASAIVIQAHGEM